MKDAAVVSELALERYRLAELPPEEMDAVRDALAMDPRLRERLAAIERSDREILAAHPPAPFAASVEGRLRRHAAEERGVGPRWRRLAPVWALSLAILVTGALLLRGGLQGLAGTATPPRGDRSKGSGSSLLLFRQALDGTAERLDSGAVAHAHDVLQVAYHAAGHRYGVILSIDGRGVVTRHLPTGGNDAAELQPIGPATLPTAYRLDDAPRIERFYFVAADDPFAVAPVVAAARIAATDPLAADRLSLPASFAQASFLLRKE